MCSSRVAENSSRANGEQGLSDRLLYSPVKLMCMLFGLLFVPGPICQAHGNSPGSLDSLWKRGLRLEQEFRDADALASYLAILEIRPDHYPALCKAARLNVRLGGRAENPSQGKNWITRSALFALRAIRLKPHDPGGHVEYLVALGMLSDIATTPVEKLRYARLIKAEGDLVLQLDPACAPAHYILGKWHQGLSLLNWAERLVVNSLFGGMPRGASYSQALHHFNRAITLAPDYILFYYGLSQAYVAQGRYDEARSTLHVALRLPSLEPDDEVRKQNCLRLLQQLKLR